MADINPAPNEYNQLSFKGGMSLQGDDTRLESNQYRAGFNLTNRFDQLDPIKQSELDVRLPHDPTSIVQELVTFGNFLIVFIDGFAYYRYYTDLNWTPIPGFKMDSAAARFWTIQVPVSTTNYYRIANTSAASGTPDARAEVQLASIAGAAQGNLPGLLVQDNINQPQFIFLDNSGKIQVRTTQTFQQWSITFTDASNNIVAQDSNGNSLDLREYVPIGSSMAWANGILFITSQDGNSILRSVSGRPLDFVIAISNNLATNTDAVEIPIQGTTDKAPILVNILPFTMQAGGTVTTLDGTPTGGTYTLTFAGQTTIPIAYNANTATIQTALQALSSIGAGNCNVTGAFPTYIVTFVGALATSFQPPITANPTALTPSSQIGVVQTTIGDGGNDAVQTYTLQSGGVYSPGGDAYATNYSVGVGGITCVRAISTGGIFVAASNANFAVTLNTTPNAPTIFGEYTFLRQFQFNATILDDRCIFDSIGDTRFIALDGLRSYNAVVQLQNEGRNSPFSMAIQQAFETPKLSIIQTPGKACGILFNNYEHYGVSTIFGPAIVKYDTINGCWVGFDLTQVTNGADIKMFAKIELGNVLRLYAVDTTNNLYTLYIGTENATAEVRTPSVCSNLLYANQDIKMNRPKSEVQLKNFRMILNNIEEDFTVSFTPYVNNRLTKMDTVLQSKKYEAPARVSNNQTDLPDVNTQLNNLLFSTPDCAQGWKTFGVIKWNIGSITQFSMELADLTPMQSIRSQNL